MAKSSRELGPIVGEWRFQPIRQRGKWAAEGHNELASRISKRLSINKKEALDILRIVGQESADLATEGWIFSIPYLGVFWTFLTQRKYYTLPGQEGKLLGGNCRLNMTESPILKKRLKREHPSETNSDTETNENA